MLGQHTDTWIMSFIIHITNSLRGCRGVKLSVPHQRIFLRLRKDAQMRASNFIQRKNNQAMLSAASMMALVLCLLAGLTACDTGTVDPGPGPGVEVTTLHGKEYRPLEKGAGRFQRASATT